MDAVLNVIHLSVSCITRLKRKHGGFLALQCKSLLSFHSILFPGVILQPKHHSQDMAPSLHQTMQGIGWVCKVDWSLFCGRWVDLQQVKGLIMESISFSSFQVDYPG
jgi:hypothetical protein